MARDPAFHLPQDWQEQLHETLRADWCHELAAFVAAERARETVYPAPEQVFHALACTAFAKTRVLLLGQDPYHGPGQAHGLAFSVSPGVAVPPSLRNIFREREADLGLAPPGHGCLQAWAERGVLLLNTVLTVRGGAAGSHAKQGWERFTEAVIDALASRPEPLVLLLWGAPAQRQARRVEGTPHTALGSAHPSPLSAYRGFFGSRPFSRCNAALAAAGQPPVDWQLPAL